jgi:hypothetical protein
MTVSAFLVVGSLAIVTLGAIGCFLTATDAPERAGEADRSETVTTLDQLAKDLRSLRSWRAL